MIIRTATVPSRLRPRPRRAFTLIELLVVICILGVLMSLAIVGVMAALESGKVSSTQNLINTLTASINNFSTENGLPPASLNDIDSVYGHDDINCGIETALLLLRSKAAKGGPFFQTNQYADKIVDEDDMGADASLAYEDFQVDGDERYFYEVVDDWGNPLAYIPREAYDREFQILDANGEMQTIRAVDHNGLGLDQPFLLWSFGPNGINENGAGDDIANWEVRETDG